MADTEEKPDQKDQKSIDEKEIDEYENYDFTKEEIELKREFANRYTDADPGYANTKPIPDPPCIHPWYGRPKRSFDYTAPRNRWAESNQSDKPRWPQKRHYDDNRGDNRHRDSNERQRDYHHHRRDEGSSSYKQKRNDDRDRDPEGDDKRGRR